MMRGRYRRRFMVIACVILVDREKKEGRLVDR